MTKYFLHGWKVSLSTDQNKLFFQELFKSFDKKVNLLCVYYAKGTWDWEKLFDNDKKQIPLFCSNLDFNFSIADENTDIFIEQIKSADVILLKWGMTQDLFRYLNKVSNLKKIWSWKIVGWSSAWAIVLSEYYYDWDLDSYNKWLGILPVKMITHWDEKVFKKLDGLKKLWEDMEVYTIAEGEFIVVEK